MSNAVFGVPAAEPGNPAGAPNVEADLVRAVREGDASACAELWRRHEVAVRAQARRLATPNDVDDVVSETFLRVFCAMRKGGGPDGSVLPYLLTTVRRTTIDLHRRNRRAVLSVDGVEIEVGSVASAEEAVVERDAHADVRAALASLPVQARTLLWNADVLGHTPAQLASASGLTANAVRCRLTRARALLRQALQPQAEPATLSAAAA